MELGFGSQGDITLHEIDGMKCAMKKFLEKEEYLAEKEMLSQLQHISGVIKLIGWDDVEKCLYLELGYMDCYKYIRNEGQDPLTVDQITNFMIQLITIVTKVNSAGIIHRDINPTNILIVLDEKGNPQLRLCDFGFAVPVKTKCDVIGVEYYMAPELKTRRFAIAEEKHDAYSVARVWYWLLENVKESCGNTEDHKNRIKELITHRNLEKSLSELQDTIRD
jgi:serine/threonine protein kinase